MNLIYLKIFWNIFIIILSVEISAALKKEDLNYRLSDVIKPSHYEIELKTYLLEKPYYPEKRFTFDGITKIILSSKSRYVDKITLNAKELLISKVHFQLASGAAPAIEAHISKYDNETEKITINLKTYMEANKNYTLELIYNGKMNDQYEGFYKSSYENEEKEKLYIGLTQFRPDNARMVFPCFDEPKFKATFQLSINRENRYQTTSNTKLSETVPAQEQRSIDIFKVTPLMSTFQLAFIISDFKARRPNYSSGDISVLAKPQDYLKTKFATDIAPQILQKLNEFTALPYSSIVKTEKLDLIASPRINSNAMSHFGLISFREDNIITNLEEKDAENVGDIIEYLAREMALLWFGNLVTPEWWTYSWLTEGLAIYAGYCVVQEAFSEYDFDQRFVSKMTTSGLKHDYYKTFPLVNKTDDKVSDLSRHFNVMTYTKGPAIFQMIAHMMGPKLFKMTLQKYLRQNIFNSVTNDDLIKILRDDWPDQSLNLRTFLSEWTEQPGYPVVTVHLNENGKSMEITQKRFLINPENEDRTLQYTIPFTYTTNVEKDFENTKTKKYLRKNRNEEITLNHKADWVIGNIQFVGYYRVNYDEQNWLNLMKALKSDNFGGIPVKNRAQIVIDLLDFGTSGLLDYEFVFKILEYLEKEEEFLPWSKIVDEFTLISICLSMEEKIWFKKYQLSIVTNVYDKLSFFDREGDKPLDLYNRVHIRELACSAGHSNCIEKAKDVFDDMIYNKKYIPKYMRRTVFCTCVREYGQTYVDYLWNLYSTSFIEDLEYYLEYDIIFGLSCTQKKEDLYKLLDFMEDHDKPSYIYHVIGRKYKNADDIIQYFVDHKDLLEEKKKNKEIVDFVSVFGTKEEHLNVLKQFQNDAEFDNDEELDYPGYFEKRMKSEKDKFSKFSKYLEDTHSSGTVNFSLNTLFISILLAIRITYNLSI